MNGIMALNFRGAATALAIASAALAGGCANDGGAGGLFSTGSLSDPAPAITAAKANPDPMCVTLASQIEQLRKEGTVERLEKAADGKTASVTVQRAALGKQTQLNKANADFIAKCGPNLPKSAMTAVAAPAAAAPAAAAAKPAVAAVKAAAVKAAVPAVKDPGVTVAAPAAAPAVAAPAGAPPQ